ncbi:MAG: hypothetical protein EHM39_05350, partial [Chloroflexi bacterium]
MRFPTKHYHWQWRLRSDPETLWPLVTNTNRFDRDSGTPRMTAVRLSGDDRLTNARAWVRLPALGIPLEYVQEPFEWTYPHRFGVTRRYTAGPLAELRTLAELFPQPDGGTLLHYHVWMRARNLAGLVAVPLVGPLVFQRTFGRSFRDYDQMAISGQPPYIASADVKFMSGGKKRLESARRRLLDDGANPALLDQLVAAIEQGDPTALAHMRPYALADYWKADRAEVLKLCLVATRHGLLDLRWDILCPSCRGVKVSLPTLGGVSRTIHCELCHVDFNANFERSVELTFRPNPAIRTVEEGIFCVGGPQDTPHVVAQQLIPDGESRVITPTLEPGRYRLRTLRKPGGQALAVDPGGLSELTLTATEVEWPNTEPRLAITPTLHFENQSGEEQLFMLERYAWGDQAALAADVTML